MEKLKMHSPNLTQDNIARIRDLFPGCVTEAKGEDGAVKLAVDFDQLRQELAESIVEGPQERYHLNWPGKREALLAANAPIAKTLRPCREESVDFDTTKNLFIEGDNLDALKLLQETYLGKVKMIYIDPPYNTGNDFIYHDNFIADAEEHFKRSNQWDETGNRMMANTSANGRFHSDWLSMLYPRLKLAKTLMHEKGLIYISLDSGEIAGLRMMCDEIFGANNFIDQLVWQKKVSPSNDSRFFSNDHELIVVYAKNKEAGVIQRQERSEKHNQYYKNPDNDPRGDWNSTAATCNKNSIERPNLYYPILNPNTGEEIWPSKSAVWAFSQETMRELHKNGRIYWGSDGTSKSPRVKNFLSDAKRVVPRNILGYQDFGHTQSATAEYRDLMGDATFDYPKPTSLIQGLIKFTSHDVDDFIVLDFFAGSGTTGQAVMQQVEADNIKRRFILVQIPDSLPSESEAAQSGYRSIADLTKERLRRAGAKIARQQTLMNSEVDVGFRVAKIDTSNMADVYYAPDALDKAKFDLFVDNIKPDRTPEDLLFQVMLDWGVDLALPITKQPIRGKDVFFVDGNVLAACFDASGSIDEAFVKELAKQQPLRVVFRDAGYKNSAVKINVEQIFKLLSPATEVKCI